MTNLGSGCSLLEFWHISHYYYFHLFSFCFAPQVLLTQCDRCNLLITVITGLCLQHLTAVSDARFAILLWPVKTVAVLCKIIIIYTGTLLPMMNVCRGAVFWLQWRNSFLYLLLSSWHYYYNISLFFWFRTYKPYVFVFELNCVANTWVLILIIIIMGGR